MNYQEQVHHKLENQHHLIPIFTSVHDIPERVREYDPSFFVVLNKTFNRFEVHSLDYPKHQTYNCAIPENELDARTLQYLWENDIRVHGTDIFKRLEAQEEKARIREERERKKFNEDFAKEFRSEFAKDAW